MFLIEQEIELALINERLMIVWVQRNIVNDVTEFMNAHFIACNLKVLYVNLFDAVLSEVQYPLKRRKHREHEIESRQGRISL